MNNIRMSPQRASVPLGVLLLVAFALPACQPAARPLPRSGLTAQAASWIRTDLYFGLTRRDSSAISDVDFQNFIDTFVTSAFPDGFTVTASLGQYRDSAGRLHKEPSRVVTVLYARADAPGDDRKIKALAADYCKRFDQESVLRSDSSVSAEFLSGPAAP